MSVDRNRRAEKTGRPRPICGHSETICCRPSFSSSAKSRMRMGPADRLLADGYALSHRLLLKPGRMRQRSIVRTVLSRISGQSIFAAGTQCKQRSSRVLSLSEASRHTQRAGRRARKTEYGDSDPR